MFSKIIAFFLMSIGGLVALGGVAVAIPSLQKVAIHTGDAASPGGLTWFHIVAISTLALVCWITSKV